MKRLLLLLFLLLPNVVMADDRDGMANKALDYISRGETDAMVDYLYSSANRGATGAPVNADVLKMKIELQKRLASQGAYRSREKVLEQEFSSRFARQTWLVGFDKDVIRAEFWFYKPMDRWVLHSFGFESGNNAKSKLLEDIKQPGYRHSAPEISPRP